MNKNEHYRTLAEIEQTVMYGNAIHRHWIRSKVIFLSTVLFALVPTTSFPTSTIQWEGKNKRCVVKIGPNLQILTCYLRLPRHQIIRTNRKIFHILLWLINLSIDLIHLPLFFLFFIFGKLRFFISIFDGISNSNCKTKVNEFWLEYGKYHINSL